MIDGADGFGFSLRNKNSSLVLVRSFKRLCFKLDKTMVHFWIASRKRSHDRSCFRVGVLSVYSYL